MNDTAFMFKLDLVDADTTVVQNMSNHSPISSHPGMPRDPVQPHSVEMKSPTSSQGAVVFRTLWDQSLSWGVSRQNIRRRIKCWMDNQRLVMWHGPCNTQRQARELIFGPDLATRARLLSFSRTQSSVVIGLVTGHNIPWQHLYIMGLSNNPICRKCGTEEETSVHVLCACLALASLRHSYLGSFFFVP
jgi:hypothetical protein